MVLYRIILVPLAKELRVADPGILYPAYAYDAAFDGLARQSAQLLKLFMKRGHLSTLIHLFYRIELP